MEKNLVPLQCALCKNRIRRHIEKIEILKFTSDPELLNRFNFIICEERCRLDKPMSDEQHECDGFVLDNWDWD